MRLFFLITIILTKFSYSQNTSSKLLYVDMSVDYENYQTKVFDFINSNIGEKTIVVIPNGSNAHIQRLSNINELEDLRNIFSDNWSIPIHDNTIWFINKFLDENPDLDFFNKSLKLYIISDKKRINNLFFDDFLTTLLHSNKLINSDVLKSFSSVNLFLKQTPKNILIPKYVNSNSLEEL